MTGKTPTELKTHTDGYRQLVACYTAYSSDVRFT